MKTRIALIMATTLLISSCQNEMSWLTPKDRWQLYMARVHGRAKA